jgi:hypothetical protein
LEHELLKEEIDKLIAAPVVERQPAYVLAKQTVIEVPGQERKELGYTLFDGIGVFLGRDEVHAAIGELGLPIGWVSMTVDQLLPGYMMPIDGPPELAELQATIARLTAENENNAKNSKSWEESAMYWMDERDRFKAEIERLKKLCK